MPLMADLIAIIILSGTIETACMILFEAMTRMRDRERY